MPETKRWHPDRKTGWSSVSGAATVVLIFVFDRLLGVQIGPEVASSMVTCIVAAVSYFTHHESELLTDESNTYSITGRGDRRMAPEPGRSEGGN